MDSATTPAPAADVPAATPIGPRVVIGLIAVVVGLLLTLDRLGLLQFGDYWRFWPLLLVAAGVLKMSGADAGPGRAAGFVVAMAGLAILLRNLGVLEVELDAYWPLLLVALGVAMIWNSVAATRPRPAAAADAPRLQLFAVLGSARHASAAADFRGGEATALLGGCEADLRRAAIGRESAMIDAFALWGGVHLRVPEHWAVEVRGIPVLGSFVNRAQPPAAPADQRLVVTGWAIMGGVEITN